jgi:L,D-transpeptidase YcbB
VRFLLRTTVTGLQSRDSDTRLGFATDLVQGAFRPGTFLRCVFRGAVVVMTERCRTGRPFRGLSALKAGFVLLLLSFLVPGPALAAAAESPVAAALASRLVRKSATATEQALADQATLAAFYASRMNLPLWVAEGTGLNPAGYALLIALASAGTHGLSPQDYRISGIEPWLAGAIPGTAAELADLDYRLSRQGLRLARDLARGRVDPFGLDAESHLVRPAIDEQALLAGLSAAADPTAWLNSLAPQRREYQELRAALVPLQALVTAGGWPAVPGSGETIKAEGHDPRIPAIRDRLRATGELPADAPVPEDPTFFDQPLALAVAQFQSDHGLEPDGAIGRQTLIQLAIPADHRLRQLQANLERWRWLPREPGPAHLIVNLAAFELTLYEGFQAVHQARVVIGSTGKRTPIFADRLRYLELNPYWNVPAKIARDEIAPKLRQKPGWAAQQGYELLTSTSGGEPVVIDPATVDWSALKPGRFPYRLRQRPGPDNALGQVKFMFPNAHDIYLHDTPSKKLFDRARRAFSHGCIRVEDPFALAALIVRLGKADGWDRARLDAAVASGERQTVRLRAPIPIYLFDGTALVAADGTVRFRPDLYARDQRLIARLSPLLVAPPPVPGPAPVAEPVAVGPPAGPVQPPPVPLLPALNEPVLEPTTPPPATPPHAAPPPFVPPPILPLPVLPPPASADTPSAEPVRENPDNPGQM